MSEKKDSSFSIRRITLSALSLPIVLATLLPLGGCNSANKHVSGNAPGSATSLFDNERFKSILVKDSPIMGDDHFRTVSGLWVPKPKNTGSSHLFPEQVKISCTRSGMTCQALTVTLGVRPELISILEIDDKEYHVDSWDVHGLSASLGPTGTGFSDRCHRHVLGMVFESGAVSLTEIPIRDKECEAFTGTSSYRLARGNYYVDTSLGNNLGQK